MAHRVLLGAATQDITSEVGVQQFADKVVLITGAASGIGRATAEHFSSMQAQVIIADQAVVAGEETAHALCGAGGRAMFWPLDVTRYDQVHEFMVRIVRTYGRLDYAFNNAGVEGDVGFLLDGSEANFDRVLAVNLKGVWSCMKHELAAMREYRRGSIVNCASIAGMVGCKNFAAYAASKHGVVGLTRTAALEYAGEGIRVNAVCPGIVDTPMIGRVTADTDPADAQQMLRAAQPVGRMVEPHEVAAAVAYLLSDAAAMVTGHVLPVEGGWLAQ